MVVNRVQEVAKAKGYNVRKLSTGAGIRWNTARAHYLGHADGISFDVLDKLCRELNVTVGELFEVIPEDGARANNEDLSGL
jgi:DNA-binding Xre family transcriptional regulator